MMSFLPENDAERGVSRVLRLATPRVGQRHLNDCAAVSDSAPLLF
ncbi:hypothetical protein SAMN02745126_04839 [Enhydrobacter aerosaccus]|uniref:Uncharacterized protein n=1 Tax=Enhydrobacter aerosaccus TaxID=225324 RepID=A0A1T4SM08_9HYPH|nr:hypothetical protein SAMN02745126_04839 [Enhydrobacter aerosaccus]